MVPWTSWNNLPDELAELILARLPAPSILAGRCVSRRWRLLLSSPSFAALWSIAAPRDLWFLIHRTPRYIAAYSSLSARWSHLPIFDLCSLDPAQALPLASAGGLLCFRDRGDMDFPTFTVCNPISGASRVLPCSNQIQFIDIIGMTFDRTTGSYTILVTGTAGAASSESITEVYNSRTGEWTHHCRSDQEFLQSFYEVHAVWHKGTFYCLVTLDNYLIAYDLNEQKWRDLDVRLPSATLRRPSLIVSSGKLLLAGKLMQGFSSRSICVWELERWENSLRWVLVDTMPHDLFIAMHYHHYSTLIRCQGHDDLMCFSTNGGSKSVVYDVRGKKWELLPDNRECGVSQLNVLGRNNLVGLPYEPSLSAKV